MSCTALVRGHASITLDPVNNLSCLLSNNIEYILFSPGLSSLSVKTCVKDKHCGQTHEILVLIAYVQKPPLNTHTDYSAGLEV